MSELKTRRQKTASHEAFLAHAMDAWGDTVLRLALNQMHDRADAEDVFQDVFLRLFDHEGTFNDEDHVRAWLLRTTINRCHDLHRRAKHRRAESLDEEKVGSSVPMSSGALDSIDELFDSDVWEKVSRLPRDLSAVVHLFYVEGYPCADIASLVSCSEATVRTRLYRARQALKKMLLADEASAARSPRTDALPVMPSAFSDEGGTAS